MARVFRGFRKSKEEKHHIKNSQGTPKGTEEGGTDGDPSHTHKPNVDFETNPDTNKNLKGWKRWFQWSWTQKGQRSPSTLIASVDTQAPRAIDTPRVNGNSTRDHTSVSKKKFPTINGGYTENDKREIDTNIKHVKGYTEVALVKGILFCTGKLHT
ncbi:hypothetical protein K435DRAFT_807243 [Dendrothele bispora CBS 962.96]|uniref:Uncharacterized protein n=1 Tax=Dendrothele bispora (strain CBS 962.96) TaxID=1314807 RepID=A0A4S8L5C0_DENBC|nr:hypothetical protein K435DRAFT_807243 [Dendrothele bispora CBS 962.96]